jgi:putative ABC transport system ATP-binding protein
VVFIQVEELRKVYRVGLVEIRALRGLSLSVEEGELVSIIGKSGSGKTTLLSIIGGLLPPTSGTVKVGDMLVTDLKYDELADYRLRVVGHIFQSLNLVPYLSAAENIALPMIGFGLSLQKRAARVTELLEVVGLSERRQHYPYQLSGGEQQRVAIAAALANDPPILLADEPTGELDTETSHEVVEYLVHINEERQKTILLVTHDPATAREGQRILRIADGQITGIYTSEPIQEQAKQQVLVDHIRHRLNKLKKELAQLDLQFSNGSIKGEEYANRRQQLLKTENVLKDELHRLGMT